MWACIITPAAHVLWKCWRFSSFYSLLLFQRADNTIKSISLRSAGQEEKKPDAFIIRGIKATLCIVFHVPQFSAGRHNVRGVRPWLLGHLYNSAVRFFKNGPGLLRHRNQWERSGKSEQHRGSRFETSGTRHITTPPAPHETSVNLPSDLWHKHIQYGTLHNNTFCFHFMTNIVSEERPFFCKHCT